VRLRTCLDDREREFGEGGIHIAGLQTALVPKLPPNLPPEAVPDPYLRLRSCLDSKATRRSADASARRAGRALGRDSRSVVLVVADHALVTCTD